MKRVLAFLLCAFICFALAACTLSGGGDTSTEPEKSGSTVTEGAGTANQTTVSATEQPEVEIFENYGTTMLLNAYVGYQEPSLILSNSINLNDALYIWYFNLGTVRRSPVYSSVAITYDYDIDAELSFEKVTSDTFTQANQQVNETIDTHSYTSGVSIGLEESITKKIENTVSAEAGTDLGFATAKLSAGRTSSTARAFSASQSIDHQWTNNWGTTITKSESVTQSYMNTYSEGLKLKLPLNESNGFKKGYSYRVSFYETIRVYGVLVYDVETQKYSVSYENFFEPGQKLLVVEESEDGYYSYPSDRSLTFDVDAAIEIAERNIPVNTHVEPEAVDHIYGDAVTFVTPGNILRFDFSGYQKSGSLDEFAYPLYQNGSITVNPMINGHTVYAVEIVGAYGLINPEDGRQFSTSFDNLSFAFADHWDREIQLTVKNISFSAPNNTPAISSPVGTSVIIEGNVRMLAKGTQTINVVDVAGNMSVTGSGNASLYIKANSAETDQDGSSGIGCRNLTLSNINITVNAGQGGNGSDGKSYASTATGSSTPKAGGSGAAGGNGGNGINCDDLSLYNGTSLTIVAGNGGNGGKGGNGEKSNTNGVGRGGKGGAGGAGGAGGIPINARIIYSDINLANAMVLTAGNGGNGGMGGAGGEGVNTNTRDSGGNGGAGGAGGDSGIPIVCDAYNSDIIADVTLGAGGNGGTGGKGGNAYRDSVYGSSVYIGNGGKGGDGGNCIKTIPGVSESLVNLKNNPTVGTKGAGGAAGGGGSGVGAIHFGSAGSAGQDGIII